MRPDEAAALRKFRRGWTWLFGPLCALILIVICWTLLDTLAVEHNRQHLLGQSTSVEARVIDASATGDGCGRRSRSSQYAFTVEWEEHGTPRRGTITGCGESAYPVGEATTVWLTETKVHESPPAVMWMILVSMVPLGGMVWLLLVTLRRIRRRVASVLAGAAPAASLEAVLLRGTPTPYGKGNRARGKMDVVVLDRFGRPRRLQRGLGLLVHPLDPPRETRTDQPLRGTLHPSEMRRGKPCGLMLHVSVDGARAWLYQH